MTRNETISAREEEKKKKKEVKTSLQVACFLTIAMVTRGDHQNYYRMPRFRCRFLTQCGLPNFKKHTESPLFLLKFQSLLRLYELKRGHFCAAAPLIKQKKKVFFTVP